MNSIKKSLFNNSFFQKFRLWATFLKFHVGSTKERSYFDTNDSKIWTLNMCTCLSSLVNLIRTTVATAAQIPASRSASRGFLCGPCVPRRKDRTWYGAESRCEAPSRGRTDGTTAAVAEGARGNT